MQVSEIIKRFVSYKKRGIIAIDSNIEDLSDILKSGFNYHFIVNRDPDSFKLNTDLINNHCGISEWNDYPLEDVSVCISTDVTQLTVDNRFCIIKDNIASISSDSGIVLDDLFMNNVLESEHVCSLKNFNYLYVDCRKTKDFIRGAKNILSQVNLIHLAYTDVMTAEEIIELESHLSDFFKTNIFNENESDKDIIYLLNI